MVILNCAFLHNQNDRWNVPYPYLMVCCNNIYLRTLFKEVYIALQKLLYDFRTRKVIFEPWTK
jgi:hypothetical protein